MPWNNNTGSGGGSGPWGNPGNGNPGNGNPGNGKKDQGGQDRPEADDNDAANSPPPNSPWGSPPGDRRGSGAQPGGGNQGGGGQGGGNPGGGGPFGPGGPFGGIFGGGAGGNGPRRPAQGGQPNMPDLDAILTGVQDFLRNLVPNRGAGRRTLALLVLAAVVLWLGTGFYRVQPDEQGVVLRFGAYSRTTPPGLNYHVPWPVEAVVRPSVTRINRIDIGFRSGAPTDAGVRLQDYRAATTLAPARQGGRIAALREVAQESLMLTGDENIIDIDFAVFWRISSADGFLFNIRNPDITVKSAAESVMRTVIGRTPIQPALTEARARIESEVLHGTQAILDQYHSGIEITQVQLQKVDPPDAVIDSFRDVQRANTDAERMRNEADSYRNDIVPRARGDAAKIVAEADAQRQSSIAEATGQAQRFASVLAAYQAAKDITMRRIYIETMQDILSRTPSIVIDPAIRSVLPMLQLGPQGAALPAPPVHAPQGAASAATPAANLGGVK